MMRKLLIATALMTGMASLDVAGGVADRPRLGCQRTASQTAEREGKHHSLPPLFVTTASPADRYRTSIHRGHSLFLETA